MRKYLCWLVGHDWLCIYRDMWSNDGHTKSSKTIWECSQCNTDLREVLYTQN